MAFSVRPTTSFMATPCHLMTSRPAPPFATSQPSLIRSPVMGTSDPTSTNVSTSHHGSWLTANALKTGQPIPAMTSPLHCRIHGGWLEGDGLDLDWHVQALHELLWVTTSELGSGHHG
jgi:hypothetical protein